MIWTAGALPARSKPRPTHAGPISLNRRRVQTGERRDTPAAFRPPGHRPGLSSPPNSIPPVPRPFHLQSASPVRYSTALFRAESPPQVRLDLAAPVAPPPSAVGRIASHSAVRKKASVPCLSPHTDAVSTHQLVPTRRRSDFAAWAPAVGPSQPGRAPVGREGSRANVPCAHQFERSAPGDTTQRPMIPSDLLLGCVVACLLASSSRPLHPLALCRPLHRDPDAACPRLCTRALLRARPTLAPPLPTIGLFRRDP